VQVIVKKVIQQAEMQGALDTFCVATHPTIL